MRAARPSLLDHSPSRLEAGFTLIEVLVTLLITSLLFGVLLACLVYGFRTQDALASEVARQQGSVQAQDAFTRTVAGALPAKRGSEHGFEGTAKSMQFDALTPVVPGTLTVPMRVRLELNGAPDRQYSLDLDRGNGKITLANWSADEASFSYIDLNGAESPKWPPDSTEGGLMPRQVKLAVKANGETTVTWLVATQADPWIELRMSNPFGVPTP